MKKIISAVLVLTLIATCGLVASAGTIPNPNKEAVHIHDVTGNHSPIEITSTKVIAQYVNIDKPFTAIESCCPSYSDAVGNLTFTLYKWAGDVDASMDGTPIAKKEWVDFKDNGWIGVFADEGKAWPAGEYLWTLSDPVQKVGVWKAAFDNLDTDIIQTSYVDGQEVEGCHECSVVYAGEGVTVDDGNAPAGNTPGESAGPVKVVPKDTENIIMFVNSDTSYVKGAETKLDVAPIVLNGRTFLPARFVAEQLGCVVTWDEATQTVLIEKDDLVIALVIGESGIRVSGEYQAIDAASFVTEGRTMVPIRAITEALGMQINYFDPGLIVIGPDAEAFEAAMATAFIELY